MAPPDTSLNGWPRIFSRSAGVSSEQPVAGVLLFSVALRVVCFPCDCAICAPHETSTAVYPRPAILLNCLFAFRISFLLEKSEDFDLQKIAGLGCGHSESLTSQLHYRKTVWMGLYRACAHLLMALQAALYSLNEAAVRVIGTSSALSTRFRSGSWLTVPSGWKAFAIVP